VTRFPVKRSATGPVGLPAFLITIGFKGGVMEIPRRLINFLNEKNIKYELLHHPEAFTAQTIAEAEHVEGHHHAKVVMIKSDREHLMAVVPAVSRIDLEKFESVVGRSVELESEAEFKPLFPDCEPGTMPPFGNLYGLTTYVDRALSEEDFIVFEAGTHTDAIKVKYEDYERAADPFVEEFAMKFEPIKRV
jgi:Ala-tRNA(Pro) deacylase